MTERVAGMQLALEIYRDAKDAFHAQATEEQVRLLLLQRELEAETNRPFVGRSLNDTLRELLTRSASKRLRSNVLISGIDSGQHKRALKMAKEFKVPDRRLWFTRLQAAADTREWETIATLAKCVTIDCVFIFSVVLTSCGQREKVADWIRAVCRSVH